MTRNVLVFDCETTGAINDTKGNPFTPANKLCCVGATDGRDNSVYDIEYSARPYGTQIRELGDRIRNVSLLVGFNIKFDLHWLRRYGINFSHCDVWDVQYAHYVLSHMRHQDPRLADVAAFHGLPSKLDSVRTEYWEQGIDTDQVPWDVLCEYAQHDVWLTKRIWEIQEEQLKNTKLRKSIWLGCQDILVTEEMEANGLLFDFDKMRRDAADLRSSIEGLERQLQEQCPVELNWGSGQHLSAFLYGGIVKRKEREQYEYVYKDGHRKTKERWTSKNYVLERLVDPIEGSSLAAEGYYETNEPILRSLRGGARVRKIVGLVLERAELVKRLNTYYEGLPEIYNKYGWTDNIIHGSLNNCRTATSRLASARPNQQNMDKQVLECLISRF